MKQSFLNLKCKQLQNKINELELYLTSCEETAKQFNPETDQRFINVWNERAEETRKQLAQCKTDLEIADKGEFIPTDEFFKSEYERLNEKISRWGLNEILDNESNKIPYRMGDFGGYVLITYFGKQAVIFVDDSRSYIKFMTPFYDEILYGVDSNSRWNADERYNSGDCGIVVRERGLYNIVSKRSGGKPLCDVWYKEIGTKETFDNNVKNYYRIAINQKGDSVKLSMGGWEIHDTTEEMNFAKSLTRDEILEKWIKAGKLVIGGYGWTYRGAGTGVIPTEKAIEMFPNYHFGKGFHEMEWTIYRGQVALSMREYSENDMW